MLEKLKQEIQTSSEVLSSMPLKTLKNQENYLQTITDEIDKYNQKIEAIYNELEKRVALYKGMHYQSYEDYEKILNELSKALNYTNNISTPYEKIGLDKLVYQLSHYQNREDDLKSQSENLLKIIKIFKLAGINLTPKDFNYTKSVQNYMEIFFENINNLDSPKLKTAFETTYWRSPDIITQIELNIRYLYLKNQKKFENYINNLCKQLLSKFNNGEKSIIDDYAYLHTKLENVKYENKNKLILDFYTQTLNIDDYSDEKINSLINNLFPVEFKIEVAIKLLNSLKEYRNYLHYQGISDEIKKLYNEQLEDKFLQKRFKQISKLEKELFKLNKKSTKSLKKTSVDKTEPEITKKISEIKQVYNEIDENIFKIVTKDQIKNNSTIFKALLMACRYYGPLTDYLLKQDSTLTYEQIDKEIQNIIDFIFNSQNTLINNRPFLEETNLSEVIVSNYRLLNVNISKEDLDSTNLDNLIENINKIIINYKLKQFQISTRDLSNAKAITEIEKKHM